METKNAPIISPETLEKVINSLTECFILECEQWKIDIHTANFSDRAHAMIKALVTSCEKYYELNNSESKQDITYALTVKNIGYDMIESYCNCIRTKCNLDLITREFYTRKQAYNALQGSVEAFWENACMFTNEKSDIMYNEVFENLYKVYEKDTAMEWTLILNLLEGDIDGLKYFG